MPADKQLLVENKLKEIAEAKKVFSEENVLIRLKKQEGMMSNLKDDFAKKIHSEKGNWFENPTKFWARDILEPQKAVVEKENPGDNGYYVLIILAGVISFLTQFLSAKLMTPKGQKLNTMNKVMFGVIPITMIILAMSSNVVFTLYVIVNSLMTAIISTIITLITKKRNKLKPEEILLKRKNIEVVEYSRNYKR